MKNYEIDVNGKWEIQDNVRLLIEPSESYLLQIAEEKRQQEEAEANRPLSEMELLKQQMEEQKALINAMLGVSE